MFATAANDTYALDARTGRTIWNHSRPNSEGLIDDASRHISRGVAVWHSRIYRQTDNAHLLCLDERSGHLIWREASSIRDRKSTRLNSSHVRISYAVFCLEKKSTHLNRSLVFFPARGADLEHEGFGRRDPPARRRTCRRGARVAQDCRARLSPCLPSRPCL